MSLNRQVGRGVAAGRADSEAGRAAGAERRSRDEVPHANVVKVIEVLAESDVSWEDAAQRALDAARRSVRNIKSIYVSDQQAIVRDEQVVGYRLNAKISFAVEDHEQEAHVARGRPSALRAEKTIRGETAMPNRDYDDSQYNRSEGRYENRDEWRDQSNAGSREWDRRGDDIRQSESRYGQRGSSYDPSRSGSQYSYGSSDRDARFRQGEYGRSAAPYGQDYGSSSYDQDFRLREGNYGNQDYRSSSSQDWRTQQTGQDWRNQQYGQSGQYGYGQGGQYGQDWRSQIPGSQDYRGQRNFNQDWRTQGFNQDWRGRDDYRGGQDWGRGQSYTPDYYRSQSNYGARDFGRTQSSQNFGPFGSRQGFGGQERDRDDESWGQQIRHAGQQMARSVKRAFRGPKGYRRSDERIREDVSDRLAAQDEFDPSDIEVTVSNGEVTLTGTVQGRHEKFLAEEIADDIGGVNEVHNQLRVRREETGTSAASQTTTSTTVGQGETALRNRNARA